MRYSILQLRLYETSIHSSRFCFLCVFVSFHSYSCCHRQRNGQVAGPQNNTENTEATNAHVSSSNKNVAESSEALDYPENDTNNNQEEEEDDDDVEQGGSGDNNQLDDDEIDEDDDDDVNTSIMPNETNADDDGPSNNPVGAAGGGGGGGGDAMKNSQSDEEYNSDGGHNVTSNGPMSGGASPMRQYGGGGMGMGSGSNTNLMEGTGPRGLTLHTNDNMSELSSQAPTQLTRSKSRLDMSAASAAASTAGASSRYQNLSYWKARRMLFYRNGDPFFPGVEYRFKPGRDVSSLETLLDKISPKMDLPRGARYVFSMDGDRKYTLDELEDGASYVLSSLKVFKVSKTSQIIFIFIFCVAFHAENIFRVDSDHQQCGKWRT